MIGENAAHLNFHHGRGRCRAAVEHQKEGTAPACAPYTLPPPPTSHRLVHPRARQNTVVCVQRGGGQQAVVHSFVLCMCFLCVRTPDLCDLRAILLMHPVAFATLVCPAVQASRWSRKGNRGLSPWSRKTKRKDNGECRRAMPAGRPCSLPRSPLWPSGAPATLLAVLCAVADPQVSRPHACVYPGRARADGANENRPPATNTDAKPGPGVFGEALCGTARCNTSAGPRWRFRRAVLIFQRQRTSQPCPVPCCAPCRQTLSFARRARRARGAVCCIRVGSAPPGPQRGRPAWRWRSTGKPPPYA